MRLITGLESQTAFPHKDISGKNAGMLSVLLSNREVVDEAHVQVSANVRLYQLSHPAVRDAGRRFEHIASREAAFELGIKAYEVMALFLQPQLPQYNFEDAVAQTSWLALSDLSDVANYIQTACERFRTEQANVCEVVTDATERFYQGMGDYAIYGAAVARQFELDMAAMAIDPDHTRA
jgi:hypothetical protein